ncbi:MAG: pyridoxal-phosphate dependent enzyme [Corynebacteriales bacterium]|nr:pyridoxal-phosphate dependent enzyme [Mycobacteriales bacterium]
MQRLNDERFKPSGIELFLKRDDLINPEIPGNKWRKLVYNLAAAQKEQHSTLLTFGGAYSNHIRATAAAGYYHGMTTIGVIRGEEHKPLNDSLQQAVNYGMRLVYIDRTTYRHKTDLAFINGLHEKFGDFYLLPEGGSNSLAVRGCAEIVAELDEPFDVIASACGTGATLAGIASALSPHQRALGFSALKGGTFLNDAVSAFHDRSLSNWSIETRYHFGGFARRTPRLDAFIADFYARHEIALEWVYVAKMMYGLFDLAAQGSLPAGSRVLAVVTG